MAHGAAHLFTTLLFAASAGSPALSWAAPKHVPSPTGAIAYHRDSGSFGYAVNAADSRSARIAALKQCGHPKCEVVKPEQGLRCGRQRPQAVRCVPRRNAAGSRDTRPSPVR